MIGLDTNVLVRLLTRDEARQAERARSLLETHSGEDEAFFVADVVLAELAWTLERTYELERDAILEAMRSLADNVTLRFESRQVLRNAIGIFSAAPAGFADCLIAAKASAVGCTSLATFDKRTREVPGAELL